jgi:H+/Cl- antiporter ClcA
LVVQTTLAGLIIGLLGWIAPESYYYGGPQMLHFMETSFTFQLLLLILVAKMLAAAVTVRGHWQGGLIIPHMFIGAILGKLIAIWIPGVNETLAMLVSMAAFNAAATQTPLASALIVLALTGAGLPVPIFLASIAAFVAGQGVVLIANKQSREQPPRLQDAGPPPEMTP